MTDEGLAKAVQAETEKQKAANNLDPPARYEQPPNPPQTPKPFVEQELIARAALFKKKNGEYGDNYHRHGAIMKLLLGPKNQNIDVNDDTMSRLGIFTQIVSCLTRYGEGFNRGGHDDSLDDIAVYAMMLKELDFKYRVPKHLRD